MPCKFIHEFARRKLDWDSHGDRVEALWAVQSINSQEGYIDPYGMEVWECDYNQDGDTELLVYCLGNPDQLWAVRTAHGSKIEGDVRRIDPETGTALGYELKKVTARCIVPRTGGKS